MCLLSSFVLLCAVQDGGTQKRLVHFNDTSITTVTVFATGAEVTRLVPLEAPVVGNMTIVLVGLPAQLDEGSVRVTADAETLHVREVSEEQHDGKPDSSEAAQERVAGARSELNAAQANKTRIQFQRTNLELYLKARLVTGSGASTISASDAAESLDFYEAHNPNPNPNPNPNLAQPQDVQHAVLAAQRDRALEALRVALELLLGVAALLHVVGAVLVQAHLGGGGGGG